MNNKVMRDVENLRKKGDYCYVLMRYVRRDFWMEVIKSHFPDMHVENSTDFNYSACFTMELNISNIRVCLGSDIFKEFIKNNGSLYRIQIQISSIGPYATYRFYRHFWENEVINLDSQLEPYLPEHKDVKKRVIDFLSKINLTVLDDEALLSTIVPGVSLEMKEENATIYHCLFDDGY